MCRQGYAVATFGLVLVSVVQSGLGLECWKCSSDRDSTCRDFFNTTRILLNQRHIDTFNYGNQEPLRTEPHLKMCEGMHTSTIGQFKNVCLKKVLLGSNGLKEVTRECRMVNKSLKEGACPDDITYGSNSRSLEFCGTCEQDRCNSAKRNGFIFAGLIPAAIMVLRNY